MDQQQKNNSKAEFQAMTSFVISKNTDSSMPQFAADLYCIWQKNKNLLQTAALYSE